MYIETVPSKNIKYRRAVLIRESFRKNGKVIKKTIANITSWDTAKVEALRLVLKGNTSVGTSSFDILHSLSHGVTLAVLGTMKRLGLAEIIASKPNRNRNILLGLIALRIISPRSKLGSETMLHRDTTVTTVSEELQIDDIVLHEIYSALDYLYKRKKAIEKRLAKKHLTDGCLVLYDMTSVYFEGKTCPLCRLGHCKEKKKGVLQIMVGLLTNRKGIPISTEVFEGNIKDYQTLVSQIEKVRESFGIKTVVMVGDRGTIIQKRIEEDMNGIEGLSFVTALNAKQIAPLLESGDLKLSFFDKTDLAEIQSPLYPRERLICCKNAALALERGQKREALLKATEEKLDAIVDATKRKRDPLIDMGEIGIRVGKVINKYKMNKHVTVTIKKGHFSYYRKEDSIARETLLDGVYIIRTNVAQNTADSQTAVGMYKTLSKVEWSFRCMKTIDLKIRPVFHYLPERVKAHVFLCMLAYYVEYHMRESLSPLLFTDEEKEEQRERASIVQSAVRSSSAKKKDAGKRTPDGFPVQSFQSLLTSLMSLTRNTIAPKDNPQIIFTQVTKPTPLQKKALDLLDIAITS
jgi:transposase